MTEFAVTIRFLIGQRGAYYMVLGLEGEAGNEGKR